MRPVISSLSDEVKCPAALPCCGTHPCCPQKKKIPISPCNHIDYPFPISHPSSRVQAAVVRNGAVLTWRGKIVHVRGKENFPRDKKKIAHSPEPFLFPLFPISLFPKPLHGDPQKENFSEKSVPHTRFVEIITTPYPSIGFGWWWWWSDGSGNSKSRKRDVTPGKPIFLAPCSQLRPKRKSCAEEEKIKINKEPISKIKREKVVSQSRQGTPSGSDR